jgi:hypothetical protein
VIETSVIVVSTLWVMSTRQLRFAALGLLAQFAAANALSSGAVPRNVVMLLGVAALAAVVTIYVAARDSRYGEDPGWRVWPGMAIAAVATVLAFAVFSSPEVNRFLQVSAFWLLCAGMSVLLTARTAVRMVIGALLMLSGTQLVLRFEPGAQIGVNLIFAWVELLLALAGAFLVINQRALEER